MCPIFFSQKSLHPNLYSRVNIRITEKAHFITAGWLVSWVLLTCIHCPKSNPNMKFPRYNMKCSGKHDTTWNFPRSVTFSPLHFMLYRGKSIYFEPMRKMPDLNLVVCLCSDMEPTQLLNLSMLMINCIIFFKFLFIYWLLFL